MFMHWERLFNGHEYSPLIEMSRTLIHGVVASLGLPEELDEILVQEGSTWNWRPAAISPHTERLAREGLEGKDWAHVATVVTCFRTMIAQHANLRVAEYRLHLRRHCLLASHDQYGMARRYFRLARRWHEFATGLQDHPDLIVGMMSSSIEYAP
ncbi:hypothetical protein F4824DRAFT_464541 [Ustulina deusta]|nr:hypothetical protein F4824DRAFT_464541 [Ustulina deusta]